LALGVEGALRVAAPYYGKQLFDNEYTATFPMEINAANFRGPVVPTVKADGTYRILALGDSITFGTGVPSERTWPHRLEAKLDANPGRPVDVINAGIEGASLADITLSFDQTWKAYKPDLVALALTGNMISLEVIQRDGKAFTPAERYASLRLDHGVIADAKIQANRFVHRFCLPSFLSLNAQNALYWLGLLNHSIDPTNPYGTLLAHGFAQGGLDPRLAESAWQKFEAHLAAFERVVAAQGARLVVTYVPPRFTLSDERRDNAKNVPLERLTIDPLARMQAFASAHHLAWIDALGALRSRRAELERAPGVRAPMYIPFDYAHLDQEGHDALAAAIAAQGSGLTAAP
jgi:lysophospholipase L1-like esterase